MRDYTICQHRKTGDCDGRLVRNTERAPRSPEGQGQDERTEIPNITSSTNVFIEERLKKTAEIDSLVFLCEHSDEIN